MAFEYEEIIHEHSIHYKLRGYLNETAELPEIKKSPVIRINLAETTGLNSIGTRNWCNWVSQVKAPDSILVEYCTPVFIKSFNNVVGALNSNMQVVSFYVPFISPTDGERTDILVLSDQATVNGELAISEVKNQNGELLEMDVLPEYFRFLKK